MATDLDGPTGATAAALGGSDPIRALAALFASRGARSYLGEPVEQAAHMLQAAALAEGSGASASLVAAALLHDVGHFPDVARLAAVSGGRQSHNEAGARWLSRWFGAEVTEPVRLHVAAKRYLCAVEPRYAATLSAESARALAMQGGPMAPAETARFEASPYACDALRLRRWDDAAKDPTLTPAAFVYYQPLLRRLLRR